MTPQLASSLVRVDPTVDQHSLLDVAKATNAVLEANGSLPAFAGSDLAIMAVTDLLTKENQRTRDCVCAFNEIESIWRHLHIGVQMMREPLTQDMNERRVHPLMNALHRLGLLEHLTTGLTKATMKKIGWTAPKPDVNPVVVK